MRCLLILALALLMPACATVPMATAEADAQGKRFSPPPGQAALYVYREGVFAPAVKMSVSVGRHALGALAPDTWFRIDLDPGQYLIRCISKENNNDTNVQLRADEIRFVEMAARLGLPSRGPRCAVFETTPEKGRAAVLGGHRAAELAVVAPAVATPAGPISIVYRDNDTNERRLNGTVRYGAVLGRDLTVPFTVENERAEPVCNGTFTNEGPNNGKFSLSCFGGYFSGNGTYERKTGDSNDRFIARGQTSRGLPIMLVIGRPASSRGGI
jgi:hypothetical protein